MVDDRLKDKKQGGVRLKNAGYTLVELIVVVAIMAIVVGIIGFSVNTIFALDVRQCAKEVYSELSKEKISVMTRTGDVYFRIYKNADGVFIDKYENDVLVEEAIKVGKKTVTVTYYSASNSVGTELDTTGIIVTFNKNNGSFRSIGEAWALFDAAYVPAYAGEYYTAFVFSSADATRTIDMWPQTGKFSISG